MSSRKLASAVAPLLVLATVPGGGDAGGSDPEGFVYAAARHCTDVINERDGEQTSAGRDASIQIIAWHVGASDPEDADREAIASAIDWYRGEVIRTRDALAEFEPDDAADAALWAEYVATFDSGIDELARRAEQARTLDESFEPARGGADGDWERREELLDEMGLLGRDCATILSDLGPLPEHRQFVTAAASTCTTIVSRRLAGTFHADRDTVFDAVIATFDGSVEPTAELEAALQSQIAEWEQTIADLDTVPTDDVPDAAAWAATLDSADEALAIPTARLAALQSGDADEIASAFQPSSGGGIWFAPELQLDFRDCRMAAAG